MSVRLWPKAALILLALSVANLGDSLRTQTGPNQTHSVSFRGGGEMWMGGPEWGWISIDGRDEIIGVTQDDVVWSDDGQWLAFVRLDIQDVPTRKGVEGMNFKIAIVRLADYALRYCLGNHGLAQVKVQSASARADCNHRWAAPRCADRQD